jgi:hypothetical protein
MHIHERTVEFHAAPALVVETKERTVLCAQRQTDTVPWLRYPHQLSIERGRRWDARNQG